MKASKWQKYSSNGNWYRARYEKDGTHTVQAYLQSDPTTRGVWIPVAAYQSLVNTVAALGEV